MRTPQIPSSGLDHGVSTKLGRPPSQGNPGYNPDLMVMDLVKLRLDASYKALIHELKVNKKTLM